MPLKKLSQNKKKMLLKPWITSGIRKSIATRDKLRKKSIKNKSDEIDKLYKFYRNKITHIKRLSFNNYYNKKLQNSFGNKRKEWEIVNQITAWGRFVHSIQYMYSIHRRGEERQSIENVLQMMHFEGEVN